MYYNNNNNNKMDAYFQTSWEDVLEVTVSFQKSTDVTYKTHLG